MRIGTRWLPAALVVLAALAPAGCGKKKEAEVPIMVYQTSDMLATPAERLARVMPLLDPAAGVKPSDADFIFLEQSRKEGLSQVRERRLFAALYLDRAALAAVRSRLKPMGRPAYQPALGPAPWWPGPDQFDGLQFYSTEGVLRRPGGFAACYPDGESLFLYGDQTR
jgi:hypothetical protein